MPNRLAEATSPYLLQHATNPVDWWEWGSDAFEEARRRDVPVLLSVGYASCHWCHVMAHESFEDDDTAALMNRLFVNVKVDREERPDVDRVYMDAVQAMSGSGGWPMTVFLTPEAEPFFAGTYFPKTDRHGHPGFTRVLGAVREAWDQRRGDVEDQARQLTASVAVNPKPAADMPTEQALHDAYLALEQSYDSIHGGFGTAPKFPQVPTLEFLLRSVGRPWAPRAEEMVTKTLSAMAAGGIRDHVAGGFSRYSVDDRWLVPHFEKMLYDNSQLARLYVRAWQVTEVAEFESVARSTLDYMLTDLLLPGRGFASAEDADSEGEEGRFYVYSWDELRSVTADAAVLDLIGATPQGNFEGKTIVHSPRTASEVAVDHGIEVEQLQADADTVIDELRAMRTQRVRPELDSKAVASWNGLAIRAFAEAGAVLQESRYTEAALDAARFILEHMRRDDGRLLRAWNDGRSSGTAFCDDYASVALGFFALFQTTGDAEWYHEAVRLTDAMVDLFWDSDEGGFFASGSDAEQLIARPKNLFDNPTPSDNSLAAEALVHAAAFSGVGWERVEQTIATAGQLIDRYPLGAGHMLSVLQVVLEEPREVAIVGAGSAKDALLDVIRSGFRPGVFVAAGDGEEDQGIPLLANRPAGAEASAYVCRGFVCDAPVFTPETSLRCWIDAFPAR